MCYGYREVRTPSGGYAKIAYTEFKRLLMLGKIKSSPDGYCFAKDTVGTVLHDGRVLPMRWDLIPAGYLKNEKITIAEVIQRKNSRAINPATGKSWGFSSYNARLESVHSLPSFKQLWMNGKRCIIPVDAFRERPDMEDAPKEFKSKEFDIELPETFYFAGLWDTWTATDGATLDSCTIITKSSKGFEPIEKIWHGRIPVLLKEAECDEWLDPKTPATQALNMCNQAYVENLVTKEVKKIVKPPASSRSKKIDSTTRDKSADNLLL